MTRIVIPWAAILKIQHNRLGLFRKMFRKMIGFWGQYISKLLQMYSLQFPHKI